jgi:hypothetical protein
VHGWDSVLALTQRVHVLAGALMLCIVLQLPRAAVTPGAHGPPPAGDVWPSEGMRASVAARTFKRELILVSETRLNPVLQVGGALGGTGTRRRHIAHTCAHAQLGGHPVTGAGGEEGGQVACVLACCRCCMGARCLPHAPSPSAWTVNVCCAQLVSDMRKLGFNHVMVLLPSRAK